jgi:ATP-dependent exoDNAse (exonuclease V) alpha subunit
MATYRFEAKIIGRSHGRSATASAAYRSAEKLEDERTGASFDYTRKRGVLHSEIVAPEGTPEWMRDRAELWNAVEKVEKRKDAQLAREVVLSLPHELTHAQRVELVQEFVRSEFVDHGMVADVTIHAPDREGDRRNHHAHVMLTMRELTGEGFGPKVRAWNSTEQLEEWREDWAVAVNRHLEQHGHAARVDHRSLADQGIDREPEPKQGPIATEMERAGRPSHAGDDRRAAQARNDERASIEAELVSISAEIVDLEQERAKRAGQGGMENQSTEEAARRVIEAAEERQRKQAQQDEEQKRQHAAKAESQRTEALARENADAQVRQAEQMREQRARLDAFQAEQKKQAEQVREEQERRRESEARGKAAEGEIRDAGDRYRMALGQHYDMKDPYGSLSRAAMSEYGAFIRDRENLNQQIAGEKDAEARKVLELRRDIEAADYMATTDRRIASQSEVISGRRNSEEAIRHRERAAEFEAQSKEMRQEYRDRTTERADREAVAQQEQQQKNSKERAASQPESSAAKEAKAAEHELTKGVEMTPEKAARLEKMREQRAQFESGQKARENSPGLDRGGMSR